MTGCCTRSPTRRGPDARLHRLLNIPSGYCTGAYGSIDRADDSAVQEGDQDAGGVTRREHSQFLCRAGMTVGGLLEKRRVCNRYDSVGERARGKNHGRHPYRPFVVRDWTDAFVRVVQEPGGRIAPHLASGGTGVSEDDEYPFLADGTASLLRMGAELIRAARASGYEVYGMWGNWWLG